MRGKDLATMMDMKKLLMVVVQHEMEKLTAGAKEKPKMKIFTATGILETVLPTTAPDLPNEPLLGQALWEAELEIFGSEKEMLNAVACIKLADVTFTPFAAPDKPVFMESFVLFADQVVGITYD